MNAYRTCRDCGQEMSSKRKRAPGTVGFGADDRCTTCYRRVLRARPVTPPPARERGLTGHGSKAERIEQAIARGLTATAICDTLGVSADDVHRTWDRLDKAVSEPDVTVSLDDRELPEISPHGRILQPHGTHAAFRRHHNRGEKPCAECTVGERRYNTDRKRRRRQRAAAA